MKRLLVAVSMLMLTACAGVKPIEKAMDIMAVKEHQEKALRMALRYFITGELNKEKIKERCAGCHSELSEPEERPVNDVVWYVV